VGVKGGEKKKGKGRGTFLLRKGGETIWALDPGGKGEKKGDAPRKKEGILAPRLREGETKRGGKKREGGETCPITRGKLPNPTKGDERGEEPKGRGSNFRESEGIESSVLSENRQDGCIPTGGIEKRGGGGKGERPYWGEKKASFPSKKKKGRRQKGGEGARKGSLRRGGGGEKDSK